MNKKQAIKIIDESKDIYLNKDQKLFAKGIINLLNEKDDVQGILDFIMKRTGLGFKFDIAPDIAEGRIAVVNEMRDKRINVSDIVDENENKLIIGENYEALKNLLLTHEEKIDIIYIDPPYNTESAKTDGNNSSKEGSSSKFIYKDKFGRNGWLNMMRERLVLARRLLSPEGVIFVSIDDSEQAYLKVLMDDIFGEENFSNQLNWISNRKGRQIDGKLFAKTYEYILVYAKNIETQDNLVIDRKHAESIMPNLYVPKDIELLSDEKGEFIIQNELHNTNISAFNELTRPNLFYSIWTDGKTISLNKLGSKFKELLPPKNQKGIRGVWRWSKDKVEKESEDLYILNQNDHFKIFTKKRSIVYTIKDTFMGSSLTTKSGGNEFEKLDIQGFNFPKPMKLIKTILNSFKNGATILDFFAGSCTTGQAVLELNREDGGNHKFILVTNNENNIGLDIAYERMHRVIVGKTSDGKNDFDWAKNNVPFIGAQLRVFNIKHYNVETSEIDKLDKIKNEAIKNLKKLSPSYKPGEIDVYYDLNGLNPYNEEQLKQEYSTDPIDVKDETN